MWLFWKKVVFFSKKCLKRLINTGFFKKRRKNKKPFFNKSSNKFDKEKRHPFGVAFVVSLNRPKSNF